MRRLRAAARKGDRRPAIGNFKDPSNVREHRTRARPLKVSGRVDVRPPIGIRGVLDLYAERAVLAEQREPVSASEVQLRDRGRVDPVVYAGRLRTEVCGRQVERKRRPLRYGVIHIDDILQTGLTDCNRAHPSAARSDPTMLTLA